MSNKFSLGSFGHPADERTKANRAAQSKPSKQEAMKWGKVINLYEKPPLKHATVIPMFG